MSSNLTCSRNYIAGKCSFGVKHQSLINSFCSIYTVVSHCIPCNSVHSLSSLKTQSVSREWRILFSKICNCAWALISSWTSVNIIIHLKQTLSLRCRCRHTGWALHNSSSFLYMKPFLYSFQSWIDVHHWIFCYYSVFVQQFNSSFFFNYH